jgi:hypothetical protein
VSKFKAQSTGKETALICKECDPDSGVGVNDTVDLKVHDLVVELVALRATTEDIVHQVKQRFEHCHWSKQLLHDHIRDCRTSPGGSLPELTVTQRTVSRQTLTALLWGDAEFHAAWQAARLAGTNMYLYVGVCAVSGRGKERRFGADLHKGMCSNGGGKVFSEDMARDTAYAVETMFSNSCPIEDPHIVWVNQNQGGAGGV